MRQKPDDVFESPRRIHFAGASDVVEIAVVEAAGVTAGGVQRPLMMLSSGQYIRRARLKFFLPLPIVSVEGSFSYGTLFGACALSR
ncbi:MAG TPA: hypothetical protein VKY85_12365 [Candidatus Angelobacter sp.]|nr:hypothetical protein [Candidatus Angelobacter sp.]